MAPQKPDLLEALLRQLAAGQSDAAVSCAGWALAPAEAAALGAALAGNASTTALDLQALFFFLTTFSFLPSLFPFFPLAGNASATSLDLQARAPPFSSFSSLQFPLFFHSNFLFQSLIPSILPFFFASLLPSLVSFLPSFSPVVLSITWPLLYSDPPLVNASPADQHDARRRRPRVVGGGPILYSDPPLFASHADQHDACRRRPRVVGGGPGAEHRARLAGAAAHGPGARRRAGASLAAGGGGGPPGGEAARLSLSRSSRAFRSCFVSYFFFLFLTCRRFARCWRRWRAGWR